MSTTTVPFQQLIGQTEKAMNAILDRLLAGAVSEPQWVALVLIAGGGEPASRDAVVTRLSHALQADRRTAVDHIAQLVAKGLAGEMPEASSDLVLTAAGRQLAERVQRQAGEITQRLWGDLPATDMDVARRVLGVVLDRAAAELSAAS